MTKSKSPATLAIDLGGTGLKASVLNADGKMEHDRVRVPTPYPLTPEILIQSIEDLIKDLPAFDRVSLGFPGMVRAGHILTAPAFSSPDGLGGKPSKTLIDAWHDYDMQHALGAALKKPTRVANDADLQGSAVVKGDGLEVVVTLGTGFGSAFFYEGKLMPHLEMAHHPFLKGKTYNEVLGDASRKRHGNKEWTKRVMAMIDAVHSLFHFDHLYVGGGNSKKIKDTLPDDVTVIDNTAGILGGITLWDRAA